MKYLKQQKTFLLSFFMLAACITTIIPSSSETKDQTTAQTTTQKTPRIKTGTWGTEKIGENVIYFFDKHDESYFLTNFACCPITIDGVTYKTSEYYFQAMKFPENHDFQEQIRNMPKASDTKEFALKHRTEMRKDWFTVSMNIMRTAVTAKFTQNAEAQKLLLSTGDKILVENNPKDSFWAAGADGNGTNHTGVIIMEVRKQLQEAQVSKK
jgi:hypothetical protein